MYGYETIIRASQRLSISSTILSIYNNILVKFIYLIKF